MLWLLCFYVSQLMMIRSSSNPPTKVLIYKSGGELGLNRTGHMSFLTKQDWTPKFAGQVLPDWTESNFFFFDFFSIFNSVKSPASGKENVRFPDSPNFEISPDFRTGRDVR